MIVGRAAERARIDALLQAARAGRGGALVVRGEPGIGKTALCAYAATEVNDMTVVGVQGRPGEEGLPYAVLHDVVVALDDAVGRVSGEKRQVLRRACGLDEGAEVSPLGVAVATLELLSVAAATMPLLAVIDDAHWVDEASWVALSFAARRIHDEPIALLVASRGRPVGRLDLDAPVVDVEHFDDATALEYLRTLFGEFDPSVASRLCEATGGNPLALRELGAALTPGQRSGAERLVSLPGPTQASALFAAQVRGLPNAARRALEVCAASTDGRLGELTAAFASLGMSSDVLVDGEASGLVRLERGYVSFTHPLARAAVYDAADPADMRSAHRALAEVASTRDIEAWHRSHSVIGPDAGVAADLEAAAERAEARGDPYAASHSWSRAAVMSPDPAERARRAFRAGVACRIAGRFEQADAELLDALRHTVDVRLRADIQQTRAHVLVWRGRAAEAWELSLAEARAVEDEDPLRATFMLMQGLLGPLHAGDLVEARAGAYECARVAARAGGVVARAGEALLGFVTLLQGDPRGEEMVAGTRAIYDEIEPVIASAPQALALTSWLGLMALSIDDHASSAHILGGTVMWARRLGAVAGLPIPLAHSAELSLRTGNWLTAARCADESHRISEELGHPSHRIESLTALASVEMLTGDHESAAPRLDAVRELVAETGAAVFGLRVEALCGLGALGRGDANAAVLALEPVARAADERGLRHPGVAAFAPNHVEALVRVGRRDEATLVLDRYAAVASELRSDAPRATAERCRGLLADDDYERCFERALVLHASTSVPFETARTEFCFGERLRRDGKVGDARRHLRRALATFSALGAADWADRARAELRSSGERVPIEPGHRAPTALTPQELRIASLVSEGRTNREVAGELFLSPKTVENHLGRIYAKLGVRRRAELAHHLRG